MKILFLGPHCCSIEEALLKMGHDVVRWDLPFTTDDLDKEQFDFCISYRYRYIIKKPELLWFQEKIINLHISLLPWNRGADPNIWSFLDNTPKGVTIHIMDDGLDTGDILLQQRIELADSNTLRTSYNILSSSIEKLLIENLPQILTCNISASKQCGVGSYHSLNDRQFFEKLIEVEGWDTPVTHLVNKGIHCE